jgi:glycosyltransferase involved in cell wall biosynthesis
MRIVHYLSSLSLATAGGVTRFLFDAAMLMAQRGHEVTILTGDAGNAPPEWSRESGQSERRPRVIVLSRAIVRGMRLGKSGLDEVRRAIEPGGVVHLHGVFEPSAVQTANLARRVGVPYVTTIHGMLDTWALTQKRLKKLVYLHTLGKRFIRGSACVHVTSAGELGQARRWFPSNRVSVVACPFDLPEYRSLPGPERARARFPIAGAPDVPLLLFLARLHPQKGAEFLIRAAGRLRREGLDCKVALAGAGGEAYTRSLMDLAAREGINDRVALLGVVVGTDKTSLYQAADLFVLPSMQESFGLVLIEAMACGTPVVSTFGVDIWQDLKDSGAAEIVEQDDRKIADAIRAIVGDPARRAAMSAKARPWVFEAFNEERLGAQYEAMYASCRLSGVLSAEC